MLARWHGWVRDASIYLHNRHPIIFVDNAVNGSDLAHTISDLEFNTKIYTQDNPNVHSCHQS